MPNRIDTMFIHLGQGATAVPQPDFNGGEWYEGYGARHGHEGAKGRLVSMFSFGDNWDIWEMHLHGEEVVLCIAGRMSLHQEHAGGATVSMTIGPGEYAINPPGCWHTADIVEAATALFITPGLDTQSRPR